MAKPGTVKPKALELTVREASLRIQTSINTLKEDYGLSNSYMDIAFENCEAIVDEACKAFGIKSNDTKHMAKLICHVELNYFNLLVRSYQSQTEKALASDPDSEISYCLDQIGKREVHAFLDAFFPNRDLRPEYLLGVLEAAHEP